MTNPNTRTTFIRLLTTFAITALAWGVVQNVFARHNELMPNGGRLPPSLLVVLFLLVLIAIAMLFLVWATQYLLPLQRLRDRLGWARWLVVCFVAFVPSWFFLYTQWNTNFQGVYIRLMIYLTALAISTWLAADLERTFNWKGFYTAIIIFGSIFALSSAFRNTTSYPFSLYWSEGNRLWDYSILFGRGIYDFPSDQPLNAFIDLGRQTLWGLPFLIPGVGIWGVRFWSSLVFSVPYILLGWVILRYRKEYRFGWMLFGLWSFLFLNQGPIYTPLILSAILVALTRRTPLGVGFILMLAAGYTARMSRFTWLFAPAIWAGVIAIVDSQQLGKLRVKELFKSFIQGFWRSGAEKTDPRLMGIAAWRRGFIFGLGGIIGGYGIVDLLPQIRDFLAGIGGDPGAVSVEGITSIVSRQPLLWERLWPNNTYPPGILLGLLLAATPVVALLIVFIIRGRWRLDIWQKLALLCSAIIFMVVGVIVSVKIGGGSNLHNLDMFLISLLFCAALAWEAGAFSWWRLPEAQPIWLRLLLAVVLIIPASQGLMKASPLTLPPDSKINEALSDTRMAVEQAKAQGEVLFMDQRQLLTFGYIKDVTLVPDYEKKLLMDQAMAENKAYFLPFNKDLVNHRFSLIISEPLWVNFQADQYHFGNENNAWVNYVSVPVLCYYQPIATYPEIGMQLLVPKEKSPPSPGILCP